RVSRQSDPFELIKPNRQLGGYPINTPSATIRLRAFISPNTGFFNLKTQDRALWLRHDLIHRPLTAALFFVQEIILILLKIKEISRVFATVINKQPIRWPVVN